MQRRECQAVNVADPDLTRRQLLATHEDHQRILEAMAARRSTRAAALVREHAYRSSENKRRNFKDLASDSVVLGSPGIALIRDRDATAAWGKRAEAVR